MTNQKLKKDLLRKLGIQAPALSNRVNKLKSKLSMCTEDAVYLVAHKEGLKLERYLDPDNISRIRNLQVQFAAVTGDSGETAGEGQQRQKQASEPRVLRFASGFEAHDPLLEERVKNEVDQMARVYPYLYVLENSIRTFICTAMVKYHGPDWWNQQVKRQLKDKVRDLKTEEKRNAWHQRRGAREVDYLDFKELKTLINKIKPQLVRDQIIPKEDWINDLIDEVYPSRCVLAHMNPLSKDSIQGVKVRFKQWANVVKAKHKELTP